MTVGTKKLGQFTQIDAKKDPNLMVRDASGTPLSARVLSRSPSLDGGPQSNVVRVDFTKTNTKPGIFNRLRGNGSYPLGLSYILPPEALDNITKFLTTRTGDQFPAAGTGDAVAKLAALVFTGIDVKKAITESNYAILVRHIIDRLRPHSYTLHEVEGAIRRVDETDELYPRMTIDPNDTSVQPVLNMHYAVRPNANGAYQLPTAANILTDSNRLSTNPMFNSQELTITGPYEFAVLAAAVLNHVGISATVGLLTVDSKIIKGAQDQVPVVVYYDEKAQTYNTFTMFPRHPDVYGFSLPSETALTGYAYGMNALMRTRGLAIEMIRAYHRNSEVDNATRSEVLRTTADDLEQCYDMWGGPSVAFRQGLLGVAQAVAFAQSWINLNQVLSQCMVPLMQAELDPALYRMGLTTQDVNPAVPLYITHAPSIALFFQDPVAFIQAFIAGSPPHFAPQLRSALDAASALGEKCAKSVEGMIASKIPGYQKWFE